MNKKLLFAAMSFAALTACSTDDFESQQQVAEGVSPIQFEVINNDGNITRASMGGTDNNTISWSAENGDLFTLYFGATADPYKSGYDNATYTAKAEDGKSAILTTPTMIKQGEAIMYWPVDTTFRIKTTSDLTIKIPVEQVNTADEIPYVSDRIAIAAYKKWDESTDAKKIETTYNVAGKDRKYPVYMRPMASQLNLKADYDGTDATLATLYAGDDPIKEIQVTSIDLLTKATGATLFTKEIPVKFNEADNDAWDAVENNAFSAQTQFDVDHIAAGIEDTKGQTAKLTAKDECLLPNNVGAKILILPQTNIAEAGALVDGSDDVGVVDAAVVVNTIYGKVVVAKPGVSGSKYLADQWEDAWYRYIKEASKKDYETLNTAESITGTDGNPRYKATSSIAHGMMQTINAFSVYTAPAGTKVIAGEQMGSAANRYVKVLLTHLDMSDLHVKSDKQLRDVARVWDKLGLDPVTVYLDGGQEGDAAGEFTISQKTIEVINEINGAYNATSNPTQKFTVKPCVVDGEQCTKIVIADGGDVQDIAFIVDTDANAATAPVANVVLKAGKNWNWKGIVKVDANGVGAIINEGTMENTEGATLKTTEFNETQNNVRLINNNIWNVNVGELNVQFDVTNNGTVTIAAGAEYRQAKGSANTTFTNQATAKPTRFGGDDAKIGKVHNSGVFATLAATGSAINNYGEIYHDAVAAKTYITTNQTDPVDFANAFGDANKMGIIILPYGNKDEDNISISHALNQGFVAVAVSANDAPADGILNATVVGPRVNYIMINGGITKVSDMPATQIKYVEFNSGTTEIEWQVEAAQTYVGMMVLSPVNVKLGTNITVTKATYLGKNMYVGGTFDKGSWNGYFGETADNEATMYITY